MWIKRYKFVILQKHIPNRILKPSQKTFPITIYFRSIGKDKVVNNKEKNWSAVCDKTDYNFITLCQTYETEIKNFESDVQNFTLLN